MSKANLLGVLVVAAFAAAIHELQQVDFSSLLPGHAERNREKPLGNSGLSWAYVRGDGERISCHLVARPLKSSPDGLRRDAYMVLRSRPAMRGGEVEFSVSLDRALKGTVRPVLRAGGIDYQLEPVPGQNRAMAHGPAAARAIAAALERTDTAIVTAIARDGTRLVDAYRAEDINATRRLIEAGCDAPVAAAAGPAAGPDFGTESKSLGQFGDFEAYAFGRGNNRVCYLVGRPKGAVNSPARFVVANNRAQGVNGQLLFFFDRPLEDDEAVQLDIGGVRYTMPFDSDRAWTYPFIEERIIGSMRAGYVIGLRIASPGRAEVSNVYSAKQYAEGKQVIDEACE